MTDFDDEGGFLLAADRAADALERRVRSAHASVRVFPLSRDELIELSATFSRTVAIARAYHLAASMPKDAAA
jgi:hypothetical protein